MLSSVCYVLENEMMDEQVEAEKPTRQKVSSSAFLKMKKEKPDKYKERLNKQKIRNKEYRRNLKMDEEKLQRDREQSRIRGRKYRERKKHFASKLKSKESCRPWLTQTRGYSDHYKVTLPALSPTMEMGTIMNWQKKEGDRVSEGDLLAEIETDKAIMCLESSKEGYLARIFLPEGSKDVPLGKLLCILVSEEADITAFKDYVPTAADDSPVDRGKTEPAPPPAQPRPPLARLAPRPASPCPFETSQRSAMTQTVGRRFATPYARSLAAEKGVDLNLVVGSGPKGQIRADDVSNFTPAEGVPAISVGAPTAPGTFVDIPLTNMRETITKRLTESEQTIPNYYQYLKMDVKLDKSLELRKELNSNLAKDNKTISLNDFIIKASALACKQIPEANSSWQDSFVRQYNTVDINVAVATDSETDSGLVAPIVFRADLKGLSQIGEDVGILASKAREGKLQPHELQGGTFTISNLGMFGIKSCSAVINQPQACTLAVGRAEKKLVVDSNSDLGHSEATVMPVTLSCDQRVLDQAVGAKWLVEFRKFMENPSTMLL